MKIKTALFTTVAFAALPLIAFAQSTTTIQSLFGFALNIINDYIVPIVFALAFLMFIFGIWRYFIASGGEAEKASQGRQFLLWSIIAFVIMFSVWGIINIVLNTVPGLGGANQPAIPTFNYTPSSSSSLFPTSLFGNSTTNTSVPGSSSTGTTYGTDSSGNPITITSTNPSTGCPVYSNGQQGQPIGTSNGQTICSSPNGSPVLAGTGPSGTVTGAGSSSGTPVTSSTADGTAPGGTCTQDSDCQDAGGQSYGCYPEGGGHCTLNGDAPQAGAPGGTCTQDSDCDDIGSASYGCYPEGGGTCTLNGDAPGTGTASTGVTCADGTAPDPSTGVCDGGANGGTSSGGVCEPGDTSATNPACGSSSGGGDSGALPSYCDDGTQTAPGGSCIPCPGGGDTAVASLCPSTTSSTAGQCCDDGSTEASDGTCDDGSFAYPC